MVNRAALAASVILIGMMSVASIVAWPHISSAHIAVHFDFDGRANGYAPRWLALSVMPGTAFLITCLMLVLPLFPGRPGNAAIAESKLYVAGWVGTIVVIGLAHALIILRARGILLDVVGNITFLVALLFTVLGNFLGKIPPNDYAGVRTPWTRTSDLSWEKTNRAGGWLLVLVGLATLLTMAVASAKLASHLLAGGAVGSLFILFPLSRYYWKRDPDRVSEGDQ